MREIIQLNFGKDSGYKYAYHQTTNRNGQIIKKTICYRTNLNTDFQKRHLGQLWTNNSPNDLNHRLTS